MLAPYLTYVITARNFCRSYATAVNHLNYLTVPNLPTLCLPTHVPQQMYVGSAYRDLQVGRISRAQTVCPVPRGYWLFHFASGLPTSGSIMQRRQASQI